MRPVRSRKVPHESSDAVGLVVALLVRYPELATLLSHPGQGTVTLSFAVRDALDRGAAAQTRESILDHVRSLLAATAESPDTLTVATESDRTMSFVRVTRDARSFTRDELEMLVTLLSDRFGTRLVKSQPAEDEAFEDETADDLIEYALETLRDPQHKRSLVGFREEKRVLVYFVTSPKKAKARASRA